jgi:glycosyltransferase involved in cell wall biosynthesis
MKVLMTTDTVGGVFTYTAQLAAELEARGEEVVVATMGPPLRRGQREALPSRVYESGYRLEWMEDPWQDVAEAADWLLGVEDHERPDIVHLCSYAHGAAGFRAPTVIVAHSCVLSWWRAVHGEEAPPQWDRYRREMREGLRGADAVVAPTQAMLAEVERDHPLPAGVGSVIHNGSPSPSSDAEAEKRPLVLGSGRFWDLAKNLTALDTAAEGLPWPVLVAGDLGPGGRTEHAESTGNLDAGVLAELRRCAGIYAAPALYEPFGLGILEAAHDRCALVLGDIPSLRELWDGAALFVDPRDERRLRWALEELIEDRVKREELAARAHRRAARYSVARAAGAYQRLYAGLLARARPEVSA